MLDETLAKIEARITGADAISPEKREELRQLLATLKSEVSALSKTHARAAESIAGLADQYAREATREQQNPQRVKSSLASLTSSLEEFETSHPRLVQIINSISTTLANLGI